MRSLLLVESEDNTQSLEKALSEGDYQVRKVQNFLSYAVDIKKFNPDILIFNLSAISDAFIKEFSLSSSQHLWPTIIFTRECSTYQIDPLIQAGVSMLKIDGLPCAQIDTVLDVAVARFKYLQSLKGALEEARTQLEDRKQIERAKAILIKNRNLSEDEAYHTLRKLAMGRNITVGEMARNVIAMADLLK